MEYNTLRDLFQKNDLKARDDFSVGRGWFPLVESLIQDLRKLGWNGDVHCIKEKFGGLRFYIGEGNEEIYERISKAEDESKKTCEKCGKEGEVRNTSWIRTLCEYHFDTSKHCPL